MTHQFGIVIASSNAEWAISDHDDPNQNRMLLDGDATEHGTILTFPVSRG